MVLLNNSELPVVEFFGNEVPDSSKVLVGFKIIKESHGSHTGIIYSKPGQSFSLLHLAWHNDLKSKDRVNEYFGVPLKLEESRARVVAAFCRNILRMNGNKIPYGIFFDQNQKFDGSGKYLRGRNGKGYTCATFVLAVLQSSGIDLLDLTSWQKRDDDIEWQEYIISQLVQSNVDDSHISGLVDDVGCVRFRPSEVAAAGLENYMPVSFHDAQIKAQLLLNFISGKLYGPSIQNN